MKKLILTSILVLLALPAFSQEKDGQASFQGIWHEKRGDENIYFIFENNTVMFTTNESDFGTIAFCTFTLHTHKIIFHIKRIFAFYDSTWQSVTPEGISDIDDIVEMDYVFSGENLILISDGKPHVLMKI
jgi:hypothetical protein